MKGIPSSDDRKSGGCSFLPLAEKKRLFSSLKMRRQRLSSRVVKFLYQDDSTVLIEIYGTLRGIS